MLFPVLIRLGPLTIHPHWVFETLAYAIAFAVYRRERGRFGDVVDSRARWYVVAAAAIGGYAGSRLLHLLESPAQLVRHGGSPLFLLGGKTIVGGLIGGLAAVEWTKQRLGVRIATGDLFAIPLAIGIAIGRIGCFLSGLEDGTYGVATRLPWGVDFGDRIARHPTQLYEIVFLAALAWLIVAFRRRLPDAGDSFKFFMIGYMAFRLGVDFIKPGARIGGLSVIQWACLATLAYYAPHVPRLIGEAIGD
jgi:phosphatidylglycerol---prolipoprotein diacylglyceryl transferase